MVEAFPRDSEAVSAVVGDLEKPEFSLLDALHFFSKLEETPEGKERSFLGAYKSELV